MPNVVRATGIGTALLALCLGGCQPGGEAARATGKNTAYATPEPASAEVYRMLYEMNLISDSEVNQKMNAVVLQIATDAGSRDSVMPDFRRWLATWAATHPEQVETARLAGGGYSAAARRVYVDTDSSRNAQIDSIRRVFRERARIRLEAARATLDTTRKNTGAAVQPGDHPL